MSEVIALVNDIWRLLDGLPGNVVLDIRERPVGETDLGGWFVPELQPHDLGAGSNEPTFHGWRSDLWDGELRRANLRSTSSSVQWDQRLFNQGQTIVQVVGSDTPMVQIFGVLAWMAVALQLGGGPGSSVATTVTSGVGLNP